MERYAHEIGRDVLGVRRRNFVRPFKRGHDMPIGVTYDSGNYQGALAAALDKFDYQAFRQEQRDARREGRLLGVGFSTYIEICGMAPSAVAGALGAGAGLWESSTVRVHPTGTVTVFTGTSPHGQGHETTLAQITSISARRPRWRTSRSCTVTPSGTSSVPAPSEAAPWQSADKP